MGKKYKKKYDIKIASGDTGKILIGIPRERVTFNQFLDNRDQILAYMHEVERGGRYYQSEGHRVDRNRDDIGEWFLKNTEFEWLWMMDSDMEHPIETGIRLASHNKPIIGALYFHRGKTHDPFVFEYSGKFKDKYDRMTHRWKPLRDEVFEFLEMHKVPMRDGALVIDDPAIDPVWNVDAVATGSMVIHRSVLETMKQPWFEYRDLGTSEDLMFCYEAKNDYGIDVWADVSTICGHYNWVPMGQGQFRTMYLGRGINNTNYTENQAINWVRDFLGISREIAKDKVKSGNAHMVGDYWNSKFSDKEPTDEEITAFYKEKYVGELYLIELLHWNYGPNFHQLRQMVMPVRNQNIIEIGGGIGTVAIQLAIQKNNVLTIEPNEMLQKFIDMRHKQHLEHSGTELGELKIMGTEWMEQVEDNYFDGAVSFDTFEHIPADDLQKLLIHLNRVIRPGGTLYYHANFSQQELYPMHLDHSEIWDNMLIIAGFAPQSNFTAIKVK